MNHLTPEQRADKNGRVVTRHVRNDAGGAVSSKLSNLSAPALNPSRVSSDYTRAVRPASGKRGQGGGFDKIVETSSGQRAWLNIRDLSADSDPDSAEVSIEPLSKDLTESDRKEFDQYANIFAHEAVALAKDDSNLPVEAGLVPEGAYVDFGGCAFLDRDEWPAYEHEYAEVEEVEHEGNNTVVLHTSQGSVAVPSDYCLPVSKERLNEVAEPYTPAQIDKAVEGALVVALEDAAMSEYDDEDEEVDPEAFNIHNLGEGTQDEFRSRIERFVKENAWAVQASGVSPKEIGSDFYMEAAGHGVGYGDRENIPSSAASALTSAIDDDNNYSMQGGAMYVGDDGKAYWGG